VYWFRIFILPKKVIKLIEQKFNRFLWCGLDVKARAKVAWERVCAPKREGGVRYQEVGNLEPSFNDGSHLEFVCQGLFHLGCLGGNSVVEREKLLASPYTTNLLLELEEDLQDWHW